jgi:glutathione S-transferase
MITVHHLNNSRSQRILWLLEELGCEYQIRKYQRDPKTLLAPAELRRVHPLGKSPVITDGGQTIAESGAIIEYLVDTYGNGRLRPPAGTPERRRYTYWLHYAEGSAMTPLLLKLIFSRLPRGPMPFFIRPVVRAVANRAQETYIDPQLKAHADYWENELGKSRWFAGDEFTAADIQMSFPLEGAAVRAGGQLGDKTRAFLGRIHERPAYQRALEKGGEFKLLA